MAASAGFGRRISQTLGSLKTGITLLILVGIASALGTFILQRPLTPAAEMEARYSPALLNFMDAVGFTNVYHAWWFIALLALVAISIIFASLERWPNAWRYYERPYRKPDSHFRAVHPTKAQFPILEASTGLAVAERAMRKLGLNPQRINQDNETSLFAERNRFAVLAVYVVHASLLLIFLGGILDGVLGYKGYISMVPGTPATNQIELRDNTVKTLPFSVRCDGAGQENYTGQFSGMPKRWWSKLTVLENGREVLHKDVEVNDPLVYRGVRFFQSGFGMSDQPAAYVLRFRDFDFSLRADEETSISDNKIRVIKFLPDAYRQDGEVFQRSKDLRQPAIQVEITPKEGDPVKTWVVYGEMPIGDSLQLVNLELKNATGLQVSYEPGQWAVWAGCLLMGLGLIISFYVLHMRFWAVTVADGKGGLTLWVGAAANKKNREPFERKFRELRDEISDQLKSAEAGPGLAASAAGK